MSVSLLQHHADAEALLKPPRLGRWIRDWSGDGEYRRARRILLAVTLLAAMLAFVLAVGNRFSGGPLFIYVPEVTLIPPLNHAAWEHDFSVHQQSPLFALCGGYQVSGMESLTVFKVMYWWEWLRVGSLIVLGVGLALLLALTVRDAMRADGTAAFRVLVAAAAVLVLYVGLRVLSDHAGLFASINIGQHRHAVDVTFASLALAVLMVECLRPGMLSMRWSTSVLWAIAILADIAFGALVQATDAGAVWKTLPGYGDGLLPDADRLFAFHPLWRNLTENVYLIQAVHRVLSAALWAAALVLWLSRCWRGLSMGREALLFALLTVAGALGAATLLSDFSVIVSIAHQFCGVLVLAAALLRQSPIIAPGSFKAE